MKRCPTCQRTYTDDSLTFCLQDGAPLLAVGDASSASYDQGAKTEILNQPVGPTIASPRPDSVTVPQQRITNPSWSDIAPQPVAPATQPPTRNRALTAGVIVISVLLLALVGIGVALLLRNPSEGSREANVDNKNSSANVNTNAQGNTNGSVSNKANANASPAPTTNSSPAASNNGRDNGNGSTPTDAAGRVEAKILRDTPLTESDLAGLSPTVLRRLRNTVYARHGRTFNTPEIQSYFDSRPWYKPRPDYSDETLSSTDRANISLIQMAEGGCN